MAVSALELRPRGAVALLDAALRLCARNTGVWALTLPGGAAVVGALLYLVDAVEHARPLALPALWLTLAWFLRGVGQGAACHYVQEVLLGQQAEPAVGPSLRAALRRLPGLFIAVAYLAGFQVLTVTLSLGISLFVLSAQVVGYAAIMQGRGSPLRLYGLCSQLLGPARGTATAVRLLMAVQLLVFLNLHIAANFLLILGRKLVGIDFTFAERFASLDNPPWLLFLAVTTFALFEPVRAVAATLLLVDGRVRQEGLDLLAAVQQLPARGGVRVGSEPGRGTQSAAAVVLALACALLAGTPARADTPAKGRSPRARLEAVARACEEPGLSKDARLASVDTLGGTEGSKLERFVSQVERYAYDEDDCESARAALERGLTQAVATRDARARVDARAASARARDILARPEFAVAPPREAKAPDEPTPPPEPPGWLRRFFDWLGKWLEELFKRDPPPQREPPAPWVSGGAVANTLVVLLVGVTVVVLGFVLLRALRKKDGAEAEGSLEVSTVDAVTLAGDAHNALSRPPEGWAHLADELASRGEYREAVRSLYLALLSRLHRDGAILYDVTLSNWDYLRAFRGRTEWKPPFRELTRRFDFAWYGNVPVGADGYREFRDLTAPLLAAPHAPQEAAGA